MGQNYQDLDRPGGFDYRLTALPDFDGLRFRGPAVDIQRPYVAFLGAAQTFGRFAERPFPDLLAERLDLPALNLGVGGAGPRHFDRPGYLKRLNGAEAVVIQVLSGRSASSSLFDNSKGGGMHGVTPLADGPVRAGDFLAMAAEKLSAIEFARVIEEMRVDYVASFLALIGKINAPTLLLWLSTRTPDYREDYAKAPHGVLGEFPQLVNARMVADIAAHCDAYVECVSAAGLPQPLWRAEQAIDGAHLRGVTLENRYYPSPQMHSEAADRLEAPLRRATGRRKAGGAPPGGRFVVLATARTGTNLLLGLLRNHPDCLCGGEVFNPAEIERGRLGNWPNLAEADLPGLLEKRIADPLGLLHELYARGLAGGAPAVGFKLMYIHGLRQRPVLDALAADETVKVVHVTRRNQLRRFVSEAQARASDRWSVGSYADLPEMPNLELDARTLAENIALTQERQALYTQLFARHETLHVVYEDLAARPAQVAARVVSFLGLAPFATPPKPNLRKTGADDLSAVLTNHPELRARFRSWAAFFDP